MAGAALPLSRPSGDTCHREAGSIRGTLGKGSGESSADPRHVARSLGRLTVSDAEKGPPSLARGLGQVDVPGRDQSGRRKLLWRVDRDSPGRNSAAPALAVPGAPGVRGGAQAPPSGVGRRRGRWEWGAGSAFGGGAQAPRSGVGRRCRRPPPRAELVAPRDETLSSRGPRGSRGSRAKLRPRSLPSNGAGMASREQEGPEGHVAPGVPRPCPSAPGGSAGLRGPQVSRNRC